MDSQNRKDKMIENLENKRKELCVLLDQAIHIIEDKIIILKEDLNNENLIQDLKLGIHNLTARKKLIYDDEFIKKICRPGKRGGFGLSRGFGEFLLALPKEYKELVDEVMDAIYRIEDYYFSM